MIFLILVLYKCQIMNSNLAQTGTFISLIKCSHVSWLTSLVEKYAFSSYTWMVLIPPHVFITSVSCISFSATIPLITTPSTLSILLITTTIRIAILFRVMETYGYWLELFAKPIFISDSNWVKCDGNCLTPKMTKFEIFEIFWA